MSEVVDAVPEELALLKVKCNSGVVEMDEHDLHVGNVFFRCSQDYYNIIRVDKLKLSFNVISLTSIVLRKMPGAFRSPKGMLLKR